MLNKDSRILIVDDFEMIRVMLRRCLAELGYEKVFEATDGKEALTLLESEFGQGNRFDAIFSDLNMPNMDGLALLEACRASSLLKSIPFVVITAEAERKYVVKALQGGAADYIVKPFSAETLRNKIEKLTQRLGKAAA